jgi:YidC/Oxa1 family membrane protein insertase
MDNQKTILAVALAIVVFLLFQAWQAQNAPKPITPTAVRQSVTTPSTSTSAVATSAATVAAPMVAPVSTGLQLATGPTVSFQTQVFTGQIDLNGGDIQQLGLLRYPQAVGNPAPYPILDKAAAKLTVQQSGFVNSDGQTLVAQFAVPAVRRADGQPITLIGKAGPLSVKKTWTFQPDSYVVEEHITITNSGSTAWNGSYFDQILRNDRAESHMFMSIFTGAVLMHQGNFSEVSFGDIHDHPELKSGPGWAGMMDHYFLTAIVPAQDAGGDDGPLLPHGHCACPGCAIPDLCAPVRYQLCRRGEHPATDPGTGPEHHHHPAAFPRAEAAANPGRHG